MLDQHIKAQLEQMRLIDRFHIEKRLRQLKQTKHPQRDRFVQTLNDDISQAVARYQQRQQQPHDFVFPADLPISQKQQEIANAILEHQVVVIAGETGSGKTTQLPKICLALGRGCKGYIGHTQPRRLAARSVASRIAQELNTELGHTVGYKVRFSDHVDDLTQIKLMTDGILLAEIQQDRLLLQYDTIIIDEAHERSLNIDFILGYLKQILPRRPDLKVIITSATIDLARFSQHFDHAPIIEVSGRTYPVDVRYRALADELQEERDESPDLASSIINAIDELASEPAGDILVFLTGEREIRDVADNLSKLALPHTEIVPLYARLSNTEQNRIFTPHIGRRIVLSTNVAETSLTVPGIKYVIDTGLVRISRYSYRTKVQRLPIEPISQASANQRKGRCGRTSNGICIRLYSEQDFLSRPEFTEPEILRTNLASVILQMTALDLGDISQFPFVEAPDQRFIKDGLRLLDELGAISYKKQQYQLTSVGKMLSQLPIDPRLARMLIEARSHGCLQELMVITSALSIQDPRERPLTKQQASDEKHRRFVDKNSDFISFVNLWRYIKEQQASLSSNQFRQLCKKEFLNYLRIREWQDVYTQIRQTVKQLSFPINSLEGSYQAIHTSILRGLLSHIGMKENEKHSYLGTRNIKFALFPNSSLFKQPPKWVVVAELVETSKLWGRIAAKIEVEWIEPLAEHLVKRSYHEPHWSKKQGTAVALEKVTLLGLPIVAGRLVNYTTIDPLLSRELFIRSALVNGEWQTNFDFFSKNRALVEEVEELEHKSRRRDILVDDETLYQFYEERIEAGVNSVVSFNQWWKKVQIEQPDKLTFVKQLLVNQTANSISAQDYPDDWLYKNMHLPLSYHFDIGSQVDGVSVTIPLAILNQIEDKIFTWQVPGLRQDLIIALIKSLPKMLRRNFVPAPNYAQAFLARTTTFERSLLEALEYEFRKMTGVTIERHDWQLEQVPDYLCMTFIIVTENNQVIASGKDLNVIKQQLKCDLEQVLSKINQPQSTEQGEPHYRDWSFGELAYLKENKQQQFVIKAYPAIIDKGDGVTIKLMDNDPERIAYSLVGIRRLMLLNIPSPIKYLHEKLPNKSKLGLYFNPIGSVLDLIDDCINCGIDHLIAEQGGMIWQAEQFEQRLTFIKANINDTVVTIAKSVEQILVLNFAITKKLKGRIDLTIAFALSDIKAQIERLIYKGFVTASGFSRLNHIARYLRAIDKRIEKLTLDPNKDRGSMLKIEQVNSAYQQLLSKVPDNEQRNPAILELRWMIEELRVNLFAQQIGTPYPISDKRIMQQITQLGQQFQ